MNLRVLIVEDQFLEAESLRIILTNAGYTVQGIAKSVDQAQNALNTEVPDIVLLDIYLKGTLNGIYLAGILHKRNIPFIYLSANSDATTLAEAMETRPDGFLVKPFREQELLIAVNIAIYRFRKNVEHISRQKKWLNTLLGEVATMKGTRNEKVLAFVKALTSFLPMDYVVIDTDMHDTAAVSLYHYQRTAFDQFNRIDPVNDILNCVFPSVVSYRKRNRSVEKSYFLNGSDMKDDYESSTEFDRIRRSRNLRSKFFLPVSGARGAKMAVSFYCCGDEVYSPDHLSLMTSLQDQLAGILEVVKKTAPDPLSGSAISLKPGQRQPEAGFTGIIGSSPKLLDALDKVMQVARFENTVLVLGETGVGKEGLVKAIHHMSGRRNKPLIKINCAAIPGNLVESELFGHEKGAFTGATEKRIGKFEQASGGTLFLDEIGELPIEVQSKLLRAIQEKEIERIGGRSTIKTDVRIVTATNKDLLQEIAAGKFRLDLYYRINVFPIVLPPLRERGKDIAELANHFLRGMADKISIGPISLSANALAQLATYNWPGNIRELEHLIERHVLQARSHLIDYVEMPVPLPGAKFFLPQAPDIKPFKEMDKEHIIKALTRCNGKVSGRGGAAELLQLRPTTLYSKMKKLSLKWPFAGEAYHEML